MIWSFLDRRLATKPPHSCRIAGDNRVGRDVACDDAAGADDGAFADRDVGENRGAGSDRSALLHERALDLPVARRLKLSGRRRRPRIGIVDEGDAVADEDVVLDRHTFADERVTRDLAAPPDGRVFLDLDERPDRRLIADLAAVEIDELRELDVLPSFTSGAIQR